MYGVEKQLNTVSKRLDFIASRIDEIENFIKQKQTRDEHVHYITITNLELNKSIRDELLADIELYRKGLN